MSEADAPSLPLRRELRKPYFIIRSPDGLGSYLKREYSKALLGRKDPLTRFLARAQLNTTAKPSVIEYDLVGVDQSTLQPLEYLSQIELQAFADACADFNHKAMPETTKVSPFEKDLRKGFRLPDPNLEPDAYWTYGPPEDRRLLIFWGCEWQQDTSLPLAPAPWVEGPTVLERLQERRMPWSAMQEQALLQLLQSEEPLARYIARPFNPINGHFKQVEVAGQKVPLKSLKPLQSLAPKLVDEFDEAAQAYYQGAHSNEPGMAYERELRRNFRLPNPAQASEAYYLCAEPAPGFLVVVKGDEKQAETLPLTDDPVLALPGQEKDASGQLQPLSTVVDELRDLKPSYLLYYIIGGAAAALILLLTLLFWPKDQTPPEFDEVAAEVDERTIQVFFEDESGIALSSLVSAEEQAYRQAVAMGQGGDLVAPQRRFTLRDYEGKVVEILEHRLNAADPQIVELIVPAMRDDASYTLSIVEVADQAGNVLPEEVRTNFTYRDRRPPQLLEISADGANANSLLLVFDEPLHPGDAASVNNYEIEGFVFQDATLDPDDPTVVVLTASNQFEDREQYSLRVRGVSDASVSRNSLRDWQTHTFPYIDTIQPSVQNITALDKQVFVDVEFNETVNRLAAETPGNYVIHTPEGERMAGVSATLSDDGRRVRLRTPALEAGVAYELQVINLTDNAENLVDGDARLPFAYQGTPDRENPALLEVRRMPDNLAVRITYNEWVDPALAESPSNYALNDSAIQVAQVERVRTAENQYLLRLNNALYEPDFDYHLIIKEVVDVVGNRTTDLQSTPFRRSGLGTVTMNYISVDSYQVAVDRTSVIVYFSDDISYENLSPDQFSFEPAHPINGLEGVPDQQNGVILNFAEPIPPGNYTLHMRKLRIIRDAKVQEKLSSQVRVR